MKLLRHIGMGLVVALTVLLALEGALRLLVDRQQLLFAWERTDGLLAYDQGSGVVARSGVTDKHKDGRYKWVFHTNSGGLREDEDIPAGRVADELRVLALGDSWIFGVNATQGKSLPAQLERLLPPKLGGRAVQVINAGVPSASAFDMLRLWRQVGWAWQLDGLLLGVPHNDFRQREDLDERAQWYSAVRGAPYADAQLYLVLRRLLAPFARPEYARIDGPATATAIADVTAIIKDALARGLWVTAVRWPNSWGESAQQSNDPWVQALRPLGVGLVGHALTERSCWGFADQGHPSEAGYAAIAHVVADALSGGPASAQLSAVPSCDGLGELGPGLPGAPPAMGPLEQELFDR